MQCPRASIWTCAVCVRAIVISLANILSGKARERERQTMTKRGREDGGGRNCVRSRFPHSCPRCVALIKTPVIFVQMEMKMKININMGAGEWH